MKALEIMHGVCARDHLEDGIFPHDSDGHSACVYIEYNEMWL